MVPPQAVLLCLQLRNTEKSDANTKHPLSPLFLLLPSPPVPPTGHQLPPEERGRGEECVGRESQFKSGRGANNQQQEGGGRVPKVWKKRKEELCCVCVCQPSPSRKEESIEYMPNSAAATAAAAE